MERAVDLLDASGFEVLLAQRPSTRPWAVVLGWIAWLAFLVYAVVPVPAELRPVDECVQVGGSGHPGHDALLWRVSPRGRPPAAQPPGRTGDCLVLAALPTPEELREFYAIRRSHPSEQPLDEHVEVALPWAAAYPWEQVATLAVLDEYEERELRGSLSQWTRWPHSELTANDDRTLEELNAWIRATTPRSVDGRGLDNERWRRGLLSSQEAQHRVELLQRVLDAAAAQPGRMETRPAEIALAVRTNRLLWAVKLALGVALGFATWLVWRRPDALLVRRRGSIVEVGSTRILLAEGWSATAELDAVRLSRDRERVRIPLDAPGAPTPDDLAAAINAGIPAAGRDSEAERQLETLLDRASE